MKEEGYLLGMPAGKQLPKFDRNSLFGNIQERLPKLLNPSDCLLIQSKIQLGGKTNPPHHPKGIFPKAVLRLPYRTDDV